MNRRSMIRTTGLGIAGLSLVGLETGCNTKDLSGLVVTIVADLGEIKPLLSELGLGQALIDRVFGYIDKAVKVAKDFDDAYRKGAFDNAVTLFANLGSLISQIAAELSVTDNRIVKLLLVGIQVARITIASLLKVQGDKQPAVQAAAMSAQGPQRAALSEIERLAALDVSGLLKVVQ